MELLTIPQYESIAKDMIQASYTNFYKTLSSPDNFGEIVTTLALADKDFDGRGNIYGYRKRRVFWTVAKILKSIVKEKDTLSLDYVTDDHIRPKNIIPDTKYDCKNIVDTNDLIEETINKIRGSDLVKNKEPVIHFLENLDLSATSKKFNISRSTLKRNVKKALANVGLQEKDLL